MSECVVRMEMPESCDCCPCLDDYGDYPRCRISDEQRGYNFDVRNNRMPNCPILAVLPKKHGRLGDLDELEEKVDLARISALQNKEDTNPYWECGDLVLQTPSIVPTTEGGKE